MSSLYGLGLKKVQRNKENIGSDALHSPRSGGHGLISDTTSEQAIFKQSVSEPTDYSKLKLSVLPKINLQSSQLGLN